jgi:sec-independent protein translocase protein TatC
MMGRESGPRGIVPFLEGLRHVLLGSFIAAAFLGAVTFFFSRDLILALVHHLQVTPYYFDISEVFVSSVELSVFTGLFFCVPVTIVLAWSRLRRTLRNDHIPGLLPAVFAMLLFYVGALFCYLVVLPSGVTFLLSYQGGAVRAMISTEYLVRFCVTMVFAFAVAFELPVFLVILGSLNLVNSRVLSKARRYALLAVVVMASLITPTPDVYNMSLLAVPLYVLYEVGTLFLWLRERRLTPRRKSV